MKKNKLISVLAVLLSVATLAAACSSKSTEETKKKKKKTSKTTIESTEETEEPSTTTTEEEPTTTTTEEPTTTTTEATTKATAGTIDTTPVDLGDETMYFIHDLSYNVTNEWEYYAQGGYQYFFKDMMNKENFMMVYGVAFMSQTAAAKQDFQQFMDEFAQSMTTSAEFPNATLDSCEVLTDTDSLCTGRAFTHCDYDGKPKELAMHVVFDRESGYGYIFMMYMDADLKSSERSEYLEKFDAACATIARASASSAAPAPTTPSGSNDLGLSDTAAAVKAKMESAGFEVELADDADAEENLVGSYMGANDTFVMIDYYRFAKESDAKKCFNDSYGELEDWIDDGSIENGKINSKTDTSFTAEGTLDGDDLYVEGYISGDGVYLCYATRNSEGRSVLDKAVKELGF